MPRTDRLEGRDGLIWTAYVSGATQEAIAARCPMIVNQIVPGQEEGNYELLRRHGHYHQLYTSQFRREREEAVLEALPSHLM